MDPKPKSVVQQKVDELLNLAATLDKVDSVFTEGDYIVPNGTTIDAYPNTEDDARKKVGLLIRLLKQQPTVEKPYSSAKHLNATFMWNGVSIVINKYRGRKCAVIKKQVVHEAEPEKVIPAKEAWVEEVEELVCEMDDVKTEVAAQVPAPEVPF
jgi:hypothetical protein